MSEYIYNKTKWIDRFIYDGPADASDDERIANIVAAIPGDVKTILDVGIGGGYIYKKLSSRTDIIIYGIDISEELVRRMSDGRVCVADASMLPFKAASFDLVLGADLIEHIDEKYFSRAISELSRVSRGYIMINSPYRDSIEWPIAFCNMCGKSFNIYGHVRSINGAFLQAIFRKNGYRIVSKKVFGKKRDTRPAVLARMARRWGKVYSREGVVCPHCFNERIQFPMRSIQERLFGAVICGLFSITDVIIPAFFKSGSEILVLLKHKRASIV